MDGSALDFFPVKIYHSYKLILFEWQTSNWFGGIKRADGWWKSVHASNEYTASVIRSSGWTFLPIK
ncbi:hypothetical protein GCM10007176_12860 [Salinicoccus roseus]|uniref:Uncharacterized protein n=1 Tax=Salinicoccus roseus TaxID=45670 RepID=A0A265E8E0_9STAP|nr:hypothetical protein CFN03_00750 [Salinicoccus roseus]GGA70049.1 hypothetical protein GCM10007176_12860 [Salinicoccus roseus]